LFPKRRAAFGRHAVHEREEPPMPIDQPMAQLAMLLLGLGLLWWDVCSIRRKVALRRADREMILAHRLKSLFGSLLVSIVGALLLLASAGLISSRTASNVITGVAFLGVCAVLYLMVCNAPHWVWRWLDPS